MNSPKHRSPVSSATSTTKHWSAQTRTLTVSNRELSVPGYLQVDVNRDLKRARDPLAKSAQAIVFLAEVVGGELQDRLLISSRQQSSSPLQIVVKFSRRLNEQGLLQEVALLEYFRRDQAHFVQLLGFQLSELAVCLRYYPLGTLHRWIHLFQAEPAHSPEMVWVFARDMLEAVCLMHQDGFVHCDLKPENFLLERRSRGLKGQDDDTTVESMYTDEWEYHVVLSDFGSTRIIEPTTLLVKAFKVAEKREATPIYAAPEIMQKLLHGHPLDLGAQDAKAMDVYALGISLFELISREKPFADVSRTHSVRQLTEAVAAGLRPTWKPALLKTHEKNVGMSYLMRLAARCWAPDFRQRPAVRVILDEMGRLERGEESQEPTVSSVLPSPP